MNVPEWAVPQSEWLSGLSVSGSDPVGLVTVAATAVMAFATVALWRATSTLSSDTKRLADISSHSHVVATIEPNRWTMTHLDFLISNTGNSTAYDIEVQFDPPIDFVRDDDSVKGIAFQKVSALRPGSTLTTYLCEVGKIEGYSFSVSTSWRRSPSVGPREVNSYKLDISDFDGLIHLGASEPLIEIAQQIRHIRDDWKRLANGSQKLAVNMYSSADREKQKSTDERRRRVRRVGAGLKRVPK